MYSEHPQSDTAGASTSITASSTGRARCGIPPGWSHRVRGGVPRRVLISGGKTMGQARADAGKTEGASGGELYGGEASSSCAASDCAEATSTGVATNTRRSHIVVRWGQGECETNAPCWGTTLAAAVGGARRDDSMRQHNVARTMSGRQTIYTVLLTQSVARVLTQGGEWGIRMRTLKHGRPSPSYCPATPFPFLPAPKRPTQVSAGVDHRHPQDPPHHEWQWVFSCSQG